MSPNGSKTFVPSCNHGDHLKGVCVFFLLSAPVTTCTKSCPQNHSPAAWHLPRQLRHFHCVVPLVMFHRRFAWPSLLVAVETAEQLDSLRVDVPPLRYHVSQIFSDVHLLLRHCPPHVTHWDIRLPQVLLQLQEGGHHLFHLMETQRRLSHPRRRHPTRRRCDPNSDGST